MGSNFLAQGVWTVAPYINLSPCPSLLSNAKKGRNPEDKADQRTMEAWPNRKKLGVGNGCSGFRLQFRSLLDACAHSTSLYLHSLFRNITFICTLALKSKYFVAGIQLSLNRAAIIIIMMTDIIIITKKLQRYNCATLQLPPTYSKLSSCTIHSLTPATVQHLCLFSY